MKLEQNFHHIGGGDTSPLQNVVILLNHTVRLVSDFGRRSLDTYPYLGQYWHICGPFIDVFTDKNPYIKGTNT